MIINRRTYFTMSDCNIDLSTLVPNVAEVTRLITLLNTRYENNWIVYEDIDVVPCVDVPNSTPSEVKVNQWKNRFKYIYETTSERYFKLLNLYKENEKDLLNKIGSSTTTKFNDTPQNVNVGDTDEYTSTVTKVSTEVDPGELINRLDNIHSKYRLVYEEWIMEFNDLFGESLVR